MVTFGMFDSIILYNFSFQRGCYMEKILKPMVATKQMIEQMFDDAAKSYNRTGPSIFTQFGTRLIEQMPLTPDARVLDVATGTGAVLLPVARRVGSEGHVTGIDLSGAIF